MKNNILAMAMGMMHQLQLGTTFAEPKMRAAYSARPIAHRIFSRCTNSRKPHQGAKECARRLARN